MCVIKTSSGSQYCFNKCCKCGLIKLKNANKLKGEWWYSGLTWYNLWNLTEPCGLGKRQVGLEGGGRFSKNTEEALGSQIHLWLSYGCSLALLVVMAWVSHQSPHFPVHWAKVYFSVIARMDMYLCLRQTAPVWRWRKCPFIPQSILVLDDKLLLSYDKGIPVNVQITLPIILNRNVSLDSSRSLKHVPLSQTALSSCGSYLERPSL